MTRILLALGFVFLFSVSAHALVARKAVPDGGAAAIPQAQDRMMPAPAACVKDAKMCPDGSSVGRVAPSCNFAPCPGEDGGKNPDDVTSSPPGDGDGKVGCTMEAKMCPDGTGVGRTGPHCEFAPCPGETAPPANGDDGAAPIHTPPVGGGHACPMFAKLCPDGSSVSPSGPNCEVPPCPGGESAVPPPNPPATENPDDEQPGSTPGSEGGSN